MRKRTAIPLLFPLFLILLNFVLKVIWLDSRDIAMDEPFSIFYAQVDFSTLFNMLKTENNPPLHFIFLHFWIKLFGISAFSVRLPSLLFSTATAVIIWQTGQRFFSIRTGVVASLLFTFSNYHQLFSHEARVYPLFALLAGMSMYLFLVLNRTPKSRRTFVFLVLTNILLIYSHYFGFFILFIQFVSCLVINEMRRNILKKYFLHLVILFLLYLPYFSILIPLFLTSASHGTWVPAPGISDLYNMVWRFSNTPVTTVVFLTLLFAALTKFILKKGETVKPDTAGKVVLIWFFLPYLLMFVISFSVPMFLDRYVIFISLGYYLLVGIALNYLLAADRWFIPVAAIAIGLMMVTFRPDTDNKRRMKEAVVKIRELKGRDGVVYICPSWLDLGFTYHYNRGYFEQWGKYRELLKSENIYPVNDIRQVDTTIVNSAGRIIYFEEWATLTDKENRICRLFEERFRIHRSYKIYQSFTVHEFTK
jgi:mannosyltransferase